jgi:HSP20 family protein
MAKEQEKKPAGEKPRSGQIVPRAGRHFSPWMGFPAIQQFREQMERMFEQFFGGLPSLWEGGELRWGLDVEDQDTQVVVRAEAPGFEPDDFDIQLRDNQIVLKAEKKREEEEEGDGYRFEQRQLYRTVTLPSDVDESKVSAEYRNGVLTITLPKTEEAKGKRIPVKT